VHEHHERAIAHASALLRRDPEVRALLLGGSIAHGYESPASDVDLLIVVSDEDHAARLCDGRVQWSTAEGCEWPGGYVEGKYVSPGFLAEVAHGGSEPARFAFQDARVLFSDLGDLTATCARSRSIPSPRRRSGSAASTRSSRPGTGTGTRR